MPSKNDKRIHTTIDTAFTLSNLKMLIVTDLLSRRKKLLTTSKRQINDKSTTHTQIPCNNENS